MQHCGLQAPRDSAAGEGSLQCQYGLHKAISAFGGNAQTAAVQGQRSTVDSNRRQILLLDEAVYNVKMDFNKRFLALREVKRRVCEQVTEVQGRLRHTLADLGQPTADVVDPVLQPDEVPEMRDQVEFRCCLSGLLDSLSCS